MFSRQSPGYLCMADTDRQRREALLMDTRLAFATPKSTTIAPP